MSRAGVIALSALALAAAIPTALTAAPAIPTWKPLDPENTLVIDTTKGRMIIEMRPEIAPLSVERVKRLAHEHFYDGLKFHRVIDGFMAQTGDPGNVDGGKSSYPNLKGEFTFRRGADLPYALAASPGGWAEGFIGSIPFTGQPDAFMKSRADHKVSAWAVHCAGVVGMGRDEGEDTANSELYLMRHAYPPLDKRYAIWGRIVSGLEVVRALKTGEPVKDPDVMTRVRVLADIPQTERPRLEVMDTLSPAFKARIAEVRRAKGADFSVCDVDIPTRRR